MRITSWNFLHGQSLEPSREGALAESIDLLDTDLLALQEVDMKLERSGHCNQIGEVAQHLGADHWGFAPTVCGTPGFSWKKPSAENLKVFTDSDGALQEHYGIAIASKVPVKNWLRLELGRSWIGLPLLIANEKGKVAPFYVKDEPRVALAAVLENGWTVINLHLSFVPFVNMAQLFKVTRWAKRLERDYSTKVILAGDFNLPWGLPVRFTRWRRATDALTYPSWKPAISFDYILLRKDSDVTTTEIDTPNLTLSDHRAISIEF